MVTAQLQLPQFTHIVSAADSDGFEVCRAHARSADEAELTAQAWMATAGVARVAVTPTPAAP